MRLHRETWERHSALSNMPGTRRNPLIAQDSNVRFAGAGSSVRRAVKRTTTSGHAIDVRPRYPHDEPVQVFSGLIGFSAFSIGQLSNCFQNSPSLAFVRQLNRNTWNGSTPTTNTNLFQNATHIVRDICTQAASRRLRLQIPKRSESISLFHNPQSDTAQDAACRLHFHHNCYHREAVHSHFRGTILLFKSEQFIARRGKKKLSRILSSHKMENCGALGAIFSRLELEREHSICCF